MSYELLLILAAFGGFFIVLGAALLWQALQPTGTHRAVRTLAPASPTSVVEAPAWCPECCTRALHIVQPDGTRTCGLCHHTTEEGM